MVINLRIDIPKSADFIDNHDLQLVHCTTDRLCNRPVATPGGRGGHARFTSQNKIQGISVSRAITENPGHFHWLGLTAWHRWSRLYIWPRQSAAAAVRLRSPSATASPSRPTALSAPPGPTTCPHGMLAVCPETTWLASSTTARASAMSFGHTPRPSRGWPRTARHTAFGSGSAWPPANTRANSICWATDMSPGLVPGDPRGSVCKNSELLYVDAWHTTMPWGMFAVWRFHRLRSLPTVPPVSCARILPCCVTRLPRPSVSTRWPWNWMTSTGVAGLTCPSHRSMSSVPSCSLATLHCRISTTRQSAGARSESPSRGHLLARHPCHGFLFHSGLLAVPRLARGWPPGGR